jgi:hypothetical protein
MMRWEYCEVTWQPVQVVISFCRLNEAPLIKNYESDTWPQILARLGDEGWEMTGCMGSAMQVQEYFLYFRRPIEA